MKAYLKNRQVWAWALYDFANSAYAVAVLSGLFPVFYKEFWSHGMAAEQSTFYLGLANSIGSGVIVLLAPLLGAMADRIGRRKRMLVSMAFWGCLNTALLGLVGEGHWPWAFTLYILATVGFSGSVVFSDALLTQVSRREDYSGVSSLGYGLGYLGGGLLFVIDVLMITHYQELGFASMNSATRWSFVSVALWWALFTLPVMLQVPDPAANKVALLPLVRQSFSEIIKTLRHIRQERTIFLFLVSYWFYIDAVDTIIRMAVDYGLSLGLNSMDLIRALLLTQFVAFPAAIAYGYLGQWWGNKRSLYLGLAVYLVVIFWAYGIKTAADFYLLAVVVGLVQGGVQALSRAFFAELIPAERAAEFFGFYNIMGKFSVVLGPVLMGAVALISGDSRMSVLAIAVLLLIGMVLLWKVADNSASKNKTAGY